MHTQSTTFHAFANCPFPRCTVGIQLASLNKHPLSVTPQIPFFDVEFANDTVLIARTQQHIQDLLWFVQDEASKYNLHLNTDKTKLIIYNSEATVAFRDGTLVPQVSPKCDDDIGEAKQVFQKTKPSEFGDMPG